MIGAQFLKKSCRKFEMIKRKSIAILGDSFCRPCKDQFHFSKMLGAEVFNYSWAGASNHNICQQAIKCLEDDQSENIFVSFTSSVRVSFKLVEKNIDSDSLYSRYHRPHDPKAEQDLLTSTYFRTQREYPLSNEKTQSIQKYHREFTDIEHQIDENYHMIFSCLSRLCSSGKKILWSQGGFEHPSFGAVKDWDFEPWEHCKISLNLWDYTDNDDSHQHVTNANTHQWIAEQILFHLSN